MNLAEISALTEDEARAYLESVRWPGGAACPRCGDTAVTLLQGKSTRPGVYKCRGCRKPFTVTVGTIFERSHISLRHWLMAFHLVCSSKKGISALQLQRNLGLKSYKSAWHMAHRIRWAMRHEPLRTMLQTVEADETWVGGRPRKAQRQNRERHTRAKWTEKVPVMVLVERETGEARAFPIGRVTAQNVNNALQTHVHPTARLMTDEHRLYRTPGEQFEGGHHTVCHGRKQYHRDGDVHINTAESFFALLKRGIHGTFHHVSHKHLHRYCDEFSFRWTARHTTDGERTRLALEATEGKRLMYKATKGAPELST